LTGLSSILLLPSLSLFLICLNHHRQDLLVLVEIFVFGRHNLLLYQVIHPQHPGVHHKQQSILY
jgi:hypothetical protein